MLERASNITQNIRKTKDLIEKHRGRGRGYTQSLGDLVNKKIKNSLNKSVCVYTKCACNRANTFCLCLGEIPFPLFNCDGVRRWKSAGLQKVKIAQCSFL